MKNTHVIELISNLGHVVSAIDDAMKNCEIFIQTVLYHRTSKEIYVETRVQLYKKIALFYFFQILCHANKLFIKPIISRIIDCFVPIKFSLKFH